MYSELRINGYRGVASLRLKKLGRINLLVGGNNRGKTSVLECLELLRQPGNAHALGTIATRRPGAMEAGGQRRGNTLEQGKSVNLRRLFTNHELPGGFTIEADHASGPETAHSKETLTVVATTIDDRKPLEDTADRNALFRLQMDWSARDGQYKGFLNEDGNLLSLSHSTKTPSRPERPVVFLSEQGMSATDVIRTYDRFVLTPTEETMIPQALRKIEPSIERIALTVNECSLRSDLPATLKVKLRNLTTPVPMESMGESVWRMLGLTLAIANAKDGTLLIDAIDTGFHYTVLNDMWRMIATQAAALSVQVFATTQNRDCYESLASAVASNDEDVRIQRIDRHRTNAVTITNQAILAAASRNVEVR